MTDLFDIIATNIKTRERRVLDHGMTREDAKAYVRMAVIRRGVEEECFSVEPAGSATNGRAT